MKDKSIIIEAKEVLNQLVDSISILSYWEYTQKINLLSNSSIGEHTRHIIEFFQQLMEGYENASIDYDKRKRNIEIQENNEYAIQCIVNIILVLEKENKLLKLHREILNPKSVIKTNYYRELMYNIEHCIHHQAIIKIAFLFLEKSDLADNFGIAKSTLNNRKQCVQ